MVPLGQGNGQDTRVRVAVESRRDKEGPLFFMTLGEVYCHCPRYRDLDIKHPNQTAVCIELITPGLFWTVRASYIHRTM